MGMGRWMSPREQENERCKRSLIEALHAAGTTHGCLRGGPTRSRVSQIQIAGRHGSAAGLRGGPGAAAGGLCCDGQRPNCSPARLQSQDAAPRAQLGLRAAGEGVEAWGPSLKPSCDGSFRRRGRAARMRLPQAQPPPFAADLELSHAQHQQPRRLLRPLRHQELVGSTAAAAACAPAAAGRAVCGWGSRIMPHARLRHPCRWGNFDHVGCRGDSTEAADELGGNGKVMHRPAGGGGAPTSKSACLSSAHHVLPSLLCFLGRRSQTSISRTC